MRRISMIVLTALGLLGASGAAGTQVFPTRPVTLVVPFPAGGPSDTLARILAEQMQEALGQPVVVENGAGASGSLGVARVARAAPRLLARSGQLGDARRQRRGLCLKV